MLCGLFQGSDVGTCALCFVERDYWLLLIKFDLFPLQPIHLIDTHATEPLFYKGGAPAATRTRNLLIRSFAACLDHSCAVLWRNAYRKTPFSLARAGANG